MFGRFTQFRVWYIVFMPRLGAPVRWWQKYLKVGFNHVFLVSECHDGGHIRIEPTSWGVAVSTSRLHVGDMLTPYMRHASAILQVSVDYSGVPSEYEPRGLFTCVTAAKAVLGLRGTLPVITPYLLYVYLRSGIKQSPKNAHIHVTTIKGFDRYAEDGN